MHRICRLSRRWHQQFHLSAQLTGHGACLREIYPPVRRYSRRAARDRPAPTSTSPQFDDEIVVREFEQYGSDSSTRVRIDPKAELKKEGRFVQARLAELEKELAVLRQGPFGPSSDFMRSLPVDEREKALKALEAEGLLREHEDLIDMDDVERMLNEDPEEEVSLQDKSQKAAGVTLRIPQRQKAYVREFNKALEAATARQDDGPAQLVLWKWYLRCQQHVLGFSHVIPEDVWQSLWLSQSTLIERPKHILMLTKDMLAAEVALTGEQWIQCIDAFHADNDTATAISTWEERRHILGPDPAVAKEFWSQGVRLYAALGRPQKAQDVAFDCLDHSIVVEPQILIPVIAAWGKSQNPSSAEKAWTCYLKMKTLVAEAMSSQIYESVSGSFLRSKHADMALAVFKDMVLAKDQSSADSAVVYKNAMGAIKDLHAKAVTEDQVNRISLAALLVLPKSFQNKFFFGSWIKKLIGNQDIDAAASVVELMWERGIKLDAKHLNGIIGAWLRDGSPASREKAERMAWAMVHARIEMVQKRNKKAASLTSPDSGKDVETLRTKSPRIPQFLRRAAPPANLETFSILLLHYTRRSDLATAEHLTNLMTGPGEIAPNAFILNHWLYASLRSSDIQGVWDTYLSSKLDITPDLETFAALWDTAKIQYDGSRAAQAPSFPSARALFAEMQGWLQTLPSRNIAKTEQEFSQALYDQIIRGFCLSSDLPGTLCALHGLKQRFNHYPDDTTTNMIMLQVARLLPPDPGRASPHGRRLQRRKPSHQKNALARVMGILNTIADNHGVKLLDRGIQPGSLDPAGEEAALLRLNILSEFLLRVMERRKAAGAGAIVATEAGSTSATTVQNDDTLQDEVARVATEMAIDTSVLLSDLDFESLATEAG